MTDSERYVRMSAFPQALHPVLMNDAIIRATFEAALQAGLDVIATLTWMVVESAKDRARMLDASDDALSRCSCGAWTKGK